MSLVKKIIPLELRWKIKKNLYDIFNLYGEKYYSNAGEDIILKMLLNKMGIKKGFYVDVGANHPKRSSNTYSFYKKGWRGINIDANPDLVKQLKKYRPDDINLNEAIAEKEETLEFNIFNDDAISTFSLEGTPDRAIFDDKFRIVKKINITTKRLETILDNNLPAGTSIDFMNVDVEGFDFNVLKSNNWKKYSPKIIMVEENVRSVEELMKTELYSFLVAQGYYLHSKAYITNFFVKNEY